jgi:hypothetical protein
MPLLNPMMSPTRGVGEPHLSNQRGVKYCQRHNSMVSTRQFSEKPHSGFRCCSLPCPLESARSSRILRVFGILLATRNDTVAELNNTLFALILGELFISRGVDRVVEVASKYIPPNISTLHVPTFPHEWTLKVDDPVILLCNLHPSLGLCSGTRMRVQQCRENVTEYQILVGKYTEKTVVILRIPLASSSVEFPIEFNRIQFHLRLAFEMTIKKFQGQALTHVRLVLKEPVFTHRQIYKTVVYREVFR